MALDRGLEAGTEHSEEREAAGVAPTAVAEAGRWPGTVKTPEESS